MTHPTQPPDRSNGGTSAGQAADPLSEDVELLRVLVSRTGTRVDAQWAIHPQLQHDLLPNEWKEVKELMAKVTDIVGRRFSEVLSKADPMSSGHA